MVEDQVPEAVAGLSSIGRLVSAQCYSALEFASYSGDLSPTNEQKHLDSTLNTSEHFNN
jgi:hypothetical protein